MTHEILLTLAPSAPPAGAAAKTAAKASVAFSAALTAAVQAGAGAPSEMSDSEAGVTNISPAAPANPTGMALAVEAPQKVKDSPKSAKAADMAVVKHPALEAEETAPAALDPLEALQAASLLNTLPWLAALPAAALPAAPLGSDVMPEQVLQASAQVAGAAANLTAPAAAPAMPAGAALVTTPLAASPLPQPAGAAAQPGALDVPIDFEPPTAPAPRSGSTSEPEAPLVFLSDQALSQAGDPLHAVSAGPNARHVQGFVDSRLPDEVKPGPVMSDPSAKPAVPSATPAVAGEPSQATVQAPTGAPNLPAEAHAAGGQPSPAPAASPTRAGPTQIGLPAAAAPSLPENLPVQTPTGAMAGADISAADPIPATPVPAGEQPLAASEGAPAAHAGQPLVAGLQTVPPQGQMPAHHQPGGKQPGPDERVAPARVQPAPAQKDSPAAFDPAAVFAARPEAAPLKSAGLNWQSPDIPVDPAGVLRQVENGIVAGLKTGRTALHLRLSPEDLGGIDLRLSTGAGGASVTLTAETQATSALLEQRLGELRQALQDAGVQVHTLNVGREQLSQQRQAPERGQFEMPQPATSASKGQPQSETPTLRRATNSQVEYLV